MTAPRFSFIPVHGHEMHLTEWGERDAPLLVMAHGLARTGRDFDEIAAGLSDEYHVICPDMIGRGRSAWAKEPAQNYTIGFYAALALGLLDHFGADRAAWLGTSMGGQIGMALAAGDHANRLSCLLLNDVGPEIPQAAAERIMAYADRQPAFDTFAEADAWLRAAYAPFGPAPETFWQRMVLTSTRRRDDGRLALHYDPEIIRQLANLPKGLSAWDIWQQLDLPMHLIYGAQSDIVPADLLARMERSGPLRGTTAIADCGHAPTLSRPADISLVRTILRDLTRAT